jgi:hypothetical protein
MDQTKTNNSSYTTNRTLEKALELLQVKLEQELREERGGNEDKSE